MSRRMWFVLGISALAGLCIAFLLGDDRGVRRTPREAARPETGLGDNPADDMAKALRKAIEGGNDR